MHTKRFKWMVGLAIFSLIGVIGALTDLETYSIGTLILALIMTGIFGFFAWKFKDERVTVVEPDIKGDPTKRLERLVKMHKDGDITDEEFEAKKEKLMRQI